MIATRIHNNILGTILNVETEERGKDVLRMWAEEQFNRPLNQDEEDSLENELEIYNDEDSDNIYTFSLGIINDLTIEEIDGEIDIWKETKEVDEYKTLKRCQD